MEYIHKVFEEGGGLLPLKRPHRDAPLALLARGMPSMILGLGSDICDIRRIEKSLARFGDRLTMRLYSVEERARAERRPQNRAATYAKRFAAKEACAKALGTGFRRGVFFADLRVVNLPSGQPSVSLHGGALARLQAITPPGHEAAVFLSLTDEYPYAYAQVIISAEPSSPAR